MDAWLIAALVVLCVLVAVLTGLLIVLLQNHGRVLLAKEELERRLHMLGGAEPGPEDLPQGLPIGSDASSTRTTGRSCRPTRSMERHPGT